MGAAAAVENGFTEGKETDTLNFIAVESYRYSRLQEGVVGSWHGPTPDQQTEPDSVSLHGGGGGKRRREDEDG
ncbi:hypothetical protein NHX12_032956 [Muraenolepis orangiensis]|uniref:Uncharacterized protein n=1 Tax=Muraenolepis orangiensis TaxID=630683 RepID=A0A9Q0IIA1_9TELE|nr:hypothetical protein NHX12_032956 [Muraenolepis orangiensis]